MYLLSLLRLRTKAIINAPMMNTNAPITTAKIVVLSFCANTVGEGSSFEINLIPARVRVACRLLNEVSHSLLDKFKPGLIIGKIL